MANICETSISVVGLKEPADTFIEKLSHVMFNVAAPHKPFVAGGVSVPRFFVETKWNPPYEEVKKASEAFPDLLFHVRYFIEQDGPTGEFVFKGGKRLEDIESDASDLYLFEEIKFPSLSLLPKYMSLTLAQRGTAAVEDAIELIKRVHRIIHSPKFVESRYSPFRDKRKTKQTRETLDALLAHMEEAAKSLTFEGVFLPDMTEDVAASSEVDIDF